MSAITHPLYKTYQAAALNAVADEMVSQDSKWGQQDHADELWMCILAEEVGEAAQARLHDLFGGDNAGRIREELVQVAAVATQWIACIDRRIAYVDHINKVLEQEQAK